MLLYTGRQRDANTILQRQSDGTADRRATLTQMRDLAGDLRSAILAENIEQVASMLHCGWELKRSLGFGISAKYIDDWYCAARKAGAQGGKLLGAGAGGFMLLLAPPECHDRIRDTVNRPQELPFRIDRNGSRVVFVSDLH